MTSWRNTGQPCDPGPSSASQSRQTSPQSQSLEHAAMTSSPPHMVHYSGSGPSSFPVPRSNNYAQAHPAGQVYYQHAAGHHHQIGYVNNQWTQQQMGVGMYYISQSGQPVIIQQQQPPQPIPIHSAAQHCIYPPIVDGRVVKQGHGFHPHHAIPRPVPMPSPVLPLPRQPMKEALTAFLSASGQQQQQQRQRQRPDADSDPSMPGMTVVWDWNLVDEFCKVCQLVRTGRFSHVAMDTEFPGFLYEDRNFEGDFDSSRSYRIMKANVDCMKVIQLGITFFDADGNLCPQNHTWQFNFQFDTTMDLHTEKSLKFLQEHGIKFDLHRDYGINWYTFSELFMRSGLVCSNQVNFITFHGQYDIAYLMKILLGKNIPATEREFFEISKIYFPYIYDLKKIMARFRPEFSGSLDLLSEILRIKRIGQSHNGGSDAYVTGRCFFDIEKVMEKEGQSIFSERNADMNGKLWGLMLSYLDLEADNRISTEDEAALNFNEHFNNRYLCGRNLETHPVPCSSPSDSDMSLDSMATSQESSSSASSSPVPQSAAEKFDEDSGKGSRPSSFDSILQDQRTGTGSGGGGSSNQTTERLILAPADTFFNIILSEYFNPETILRNYGLEYRMESRYLGFIEKNYAYQPSNL